MAETNRPGPPPAPGDRPKGSEREHERYLETAGERQEALDRAAELTQEHVGLSRPVRLQEAGNRRRFEIQLGDEWYRFHPGPGDAALKNEFAADELYVYTVEPRSVQGGRAYEIVVEAGSNEDLALAYSDRLTYKELASQLQEQIPGEVPRDRGKIDQDVRDHALEIANFDPDASAAEYLRYLRDQGLVQVSEQEG